MTELSSGRQRVKLGDVAINSTAVSAEPQAEGFDRYIIGKHIPEAADCIETWGPVGDSDFGPRIRTIFQPGDVVCTTRGPNLKVARVEFKGLGAHTNFYLRTANPEVLLQPYLEAVVRSNGFQQHLVNNFRGSVNLFVNWSDAAKYEFALPTLEEQHKAVAILSSVSEAIQATQSLIEQTRRVKEGLLQDLLTKGIGHKEFKKTKIGEIPEPWVVFRLKDLVDTKRKITYGIVQPGSHHDDGIPLIRGQNYISGWEPLSQYRRVDPSLHSQYRRSITLPGDVLLCIVGATTGASAIVPESMPEANITQTTARICAGEAALPSFLNYYLKSQLGQSEVRRFMKGSAQPGLNLTDVERFRIALPPLPEQQKIAAMLSSVDEGIADGEERAKQLQRVKAGILQDLLTRKSVGESVKPLDECTLLPGDPA